MVLLEWLLPIHEQNIAEERARIKLLSENIAGASTTKLFDDWEKRMRRFLRDHLVEIVAPDEVEQHVDYLRALTNGLTLSAIQHPASWPSEHLIETLKDAVARLGLEADTPVTRT
jgi:hypothetical protein